MFRRVCFQGLSLDPAVLAKFSRTNTCMLLPLLKNTRSRAKEREKEVGGGGDARVGAVRKWFMERGAQGVIRLKYAPPRTQEPSQGGSPPGLPLALGHTSLRNQGR